jgi:hypothetical protein
MNKLSTYNLNKFNVNFIILVFFFYPHQSNAQDLLKNELEDGAAYTQLLITVYLEAGYNFEADVLISDSNAIYLNVEALFKTLQIKCVQNSNILDGFIDNEKNKYRIDFEKKQITIGKKIINIKDSLIKEFGIKYISSEIMSDAFGLNFLYNPRSLSAKLTPSFELPFLKQLRLKKTRENISMLQGKQPLVIDTIIPRNYHYFKFGTIDWSLSSSQSINNSINNSGNITFGTELLFGAANFSIVYNNQQKFDMKQVQYNWRWVNNDNKVIKQVQLGHIFTQSIAQLRGNLIGATVNNSPNIVRKASGFYTINNITEPNWKVELYINDILIDFTEADASGLYVFKVPIVYGYTTLRFKFYGPLGEERTEERTMNTPYTFMPAKKIEYNLTTGIVQDTLKSRFAKVGLNYGLTKSLTVAAGVEYLSNIPDNPFIPFAKIDFQPFSKLVVNLKYAHNVSLIGLLNLYVTKDAFLEFDYSIFKNNQVVQRSNLIQELNIKFSTPFKMNFFAGLGKIEFNKFMYENFSYNQFNLTLSGFYKKLKINSSSFINWASKDKPRMNSMLGLSYRLRNGFALNSSTSYNLTTTNLMSFSVGIQKRISKLFISASYTKDMLSKNDNFFLNLNYDLPFSRTGVNSSFRNNNLYISEFARGSLAFIGNNSFVHTGNNSAIDKGGILLYPYVDQNQNGEFDKGEKKVLLSSVNISVGKPIISKKDSIVRVFDLNAFVNYTIEFSDTSLDYVSLRFKHKTYQILVDPNQYKHVYVPIISVGEVSGMVYFKSGEILKGQSRVRLQIYDEKGDKIAETLSEFDGYFSYLGLKPGKYTVRVDETQLKNLNFKSLPAVHQITIKVSEYGDIVGDLTFTLSARIPIAPKE